MILVMAGTSDGRDLASALQAQGHSVLLTVTSEHGAALAADAGLKVHTGPLDQAALVELLRQKEAELLVDATHPYALTASETAMAAATAAGLPYLRYERPQSQDDLTFVTRFETLEALVEAVRLEQGNVLLTLGSNQIVHFSDLPNRNNLYVRLLPIPELIEKCNRLGFRSDRLLAMQGPFSQAFNEALIRQWDISVLVTKDSAGPGGFYEKLEAARQTGSRVFLLGRPALDYPEAYEAVEQVMERVKALLER